VSERRARAGRRVYDPVKDEQWREELIQAAVKAYSGLLSAECADTHAQPRPFSPEVSTKNESAAIALQQRKKNPNGE
jgi:hypothetical protein